MNPVIFLPPAGGGTPDLEIFRSGLEPAARFEVVGYPGWQRYQQEDFSAEALISDLTKQIANRVPAGPIRILGYSLGGHFAYAAAIRLQAMGREIGGIWAIDSFMVESAAPSEGWVGRAIKQAVELIRKGRLSDFRHFLRTRFWRAVVRFSTSRKSTKSMPPPSSDPVLQYEFSMRLLLKEVAPWLASVDRNPVALHAPAALLRTSHTAGDDAAWRRRCPNIAIVEVRGHHHNLLDAEHSSSIRDGIMESRRIWQETGAAVMQGAGRE